jgi:hypothetical protein
MFAAAGGELTVRIIPVSVQKPTPMPMIFRYWGRGRPIRVRLALCPVQKQPRRPFCRFCSPDLVVKKIAEARALPLVFLPLARLHFQLGEMCCDALPMSASGH